MCTHARDIMGAIMRKAMSLPIIGIISHRIPKPKLIITSPSIVKKYVEVVFQLIWRDCIGPAFLSTIKKRERLRRKKIINPGIIKNSRPIMVVIAQRQLVIKKLGAMRND